MAETTQKQWYKMKGNHDGMGAFRSVKPNHQPVQVDCMDASHQSVGSDSMNASHQPVQVDGMTQAGLDLNHANMFQPRMAYYSDDNAPIIVYITKRERDYYTKKYANAWGPYGTYFRSQIIHPKLTVIRNKYYRTLTVEDRTNIFPS